MNAHGRLPTGNRPLDRLLGGGFARGQLGEIFSQSGPLASIVAMNACAAVAEAGGRAVYAAVTPDHHYDAMCATPRVSDAGVVAVSSLEEAMAVFDGLTTKAGLDLIVVGNVALLHTARVRHVEPQRLFELRARLMKSWLARALSKAKKLQFGMLLLNTELPRPTVGGIAFRTPMERVIARFASVRVRVLPEHPTMDPWVVEQDPASGNFVERRSPDLYRLEVFGLRMRPVGQCQFAVPPESADRTD